MSDLRIGVIGSGGRGGLAGHAHHPDEGSRVVACCDVNERALQGNREKYGDDIFTTHDYRELLKEIQGSYNAESQTSELGVLEPVLTADVLLLDDLGASKPSPWAMETVGHILNSRYNEKRITLLTTNYLDTGPAAVPTSTPTSMPASRRTFLPSGQAVAGAREDNLTDRLGMRIRSRLYEMCRTVELFAPDYRREVRQAGRVRS